MTGKPRVLVTGASGGIGRAVALRFAEQGASVAVCGHRNRAELEAVAHGVEERGGSALAIAGDLSDAAGVESLVASAAREWGGLDVVVSNAGIVDLAPLSETSLDAWDRLFAVNCRAAFIIAKNAWPHLKASRGSLVAVASASGVQPFPGLGAYSASKSALIMLVRQLAQEWAADGVRANCVSPGFVRTPMTEPAYADPKTLAAREKLVPLGRISDPYADIAGLVTFLASPDAAFVTGQNLVADGGVLDSIQSHTVGRPTPR